MSSTLISPSRVQGMGPNGKKTVPQVKVFEYLGVLYVTERYAVQTRGSVHCPQRCSTYIDW